MCPFQKFLRVNNLALIVSPTVTAGSGGTGSNPSIYEIAGTTNVTGADECRGPRHK